MKNPNLEILLSKIGEEIQGKKEAVFCFFSPSGVKQVLEHLDPKILDLKQIKVNELCFKLYVVFVQLT